jgi:hypothetical protein
MTPEQIGTLQIIAQLFDKLGTLPVASTVTLIIIGPWVAVIYITMGHRKRFEEVVKRYENNISLVKDYEKLATTLQDLVIMNTEVMTDVKVKAEHNLFCPVVRRQTKQTEVMV